MLIECRLVEEYYLGSPNVGEPTNNLLQFGVKHFYFYHISIDLYIERG